MEPNKIINTYQDTLKNDAILGDMYHVLNEMGISVGKKRKDILDTFLTNRRYFDTNIISTVATGNKIKNLPDAYKQGYARAINHVDTMPSIFSSEGSAPKWKALADYTIAGVSDPTNLVSLIAGFFTAGTGTAAIQGGKEAAKQGVKELLKAKTKAVLSKPVLKAIGTEATISGVGGGLQAARSQNVDIDIGRRDKYDASQIGLQAVLEGLGTPVLGASANVLGSTALNVSKGLVVNPAGKLVKKAFPETVKYTAQEATHYGNLLKKYLTNYLFPAGGLDTATLRNLEIGQSELKLIKELSEEVTDNIDIAFKKDFKNTDADIELVNKAMENDSTALDAIKIRSPRMTKALEGWDQLRKLTLKEAQRKNTGISNRLRGIYKLNKDYTRDIYERTSGMIGPREPFSSWLTRHGNKEEVQNLKNLIKSDKALQIQFGLRNGTLDNEFNIITDEGPKSFFNANNKGKVDEKGNPIYNEKKADAIIMDEIYKAYYPKKRSKSRLGALRAKRKDISDAMKKIWGLNYKPAVRASETIAGIIEPLTEIRIANQLAGSLLNRKLAVRATDPGDAREKAIDLGMSPNETLVPLISVDRNLDPAFNIRAELYNKELGTIYVKKSMADKIKTMTDRKGIWSELGIENNMLSTIFKGFAAAQGFLKKAMTVYSPKAQLRNLIGMPLYVAASGNIKGMGKFARQYLQGGKKQKERLQSIARRLGVQGSNVELNQIAARLAEIEGIGPDKAGGISGWLTRRFVDVAGGGMPVLERLSWFKKIVRVAEKAYTKTDDLGKLMTLLGERDSVEKLWKGYSETQKQQYRKEFWTNFAEEIPQEKLAKIQVTKAGLPSKAQQRFKKQYEKNLKAYDNELLWELAAQKAMDVVPVYSRIPRIFDKMKDLPVLGSFMAFPAENARNTYKILRLGGEEIRDGFASGNTALVRQGYKRLVSKILAASAPSVVAYTWNEVNGTNEAMDYVRKMAPEWSEYHALQVRKKPNGKLAYSDISYNNPDQFVLDLVMPFMVEVANGRDVTKSLDKLFPLVAGNMFKPFLDKSLATQLGLYMTDYAAAETDEGSARALAKIYKLVEPGILKMVTDLAGDFKANQVMDILSEKLGGEGRIGTDIKRSLDPLYFGEKRKYFEDSGELADYFAKIGADPTIGWALYPFGLGVKETELDPIKSLGFATSNLMSNANSDYNETTKSIRNDLLDIDSRTSLTSMLNDLKESIEENYAAQQGVYDLITSMKDFMSIEEIRKILRSKKIKAASGLSNNEIEKVLKGQFAVPKFNQSFFNELSKTRKGMYRYIPHIRAQILNLERKYQNKDLRDLNVPEVLIKNNKVEK